MCTCVCVSVVCGEVCIFACMHGPRARMVGEYLDRSIHTHTWSQLAANEVPDERAAAATLQTRALRPDAEADERTLEPPHPIK